MYHWLISSCDVPDFLEQEDDKDLWKDILVPPNASGQFIKPRCTKSPNYNL